MKKERPLSGKELKILDSQLSQLNKRFKRQIRFLLVWVLLALVVGLYAFFQINADKVILLFAVVAIYIGIGVWVVAGEYIKQSKRRKEIATLKKKNLVTSIEVNSSLFYELREQEDEGVYYLFQLDDNIVLSFGGQDFYPSKEFPSDSFEIVQGFGVNNEIVFLEVFNYGKKITPIKVIEGQQKSDLLNSPIYPNPYTLTVVDGRIEDII